MALREQDFNNNMQQSTRKKRSRITFEVSPEMQERIKLLALLNRSSIGEYLEPILDEVLPKTVDIVQERRPITQETVDGFRQFREEMQRKHGKQSTDSVDIIHQMREERTKELEQR